MRLPVGFGTYRTVDGNADHERALRHALEHGVPLIDTSSNYGNGRSEKLVGRMLNSVDESRSAGVELITKLGYVQGEALEMAMLLARKMQRGT